MVSIGAKVARHSSSFSIMLIFPSLVQKIKRNLIRKAQIKKSYNKLKSREPKIFDAPEKTMGEFATTADTILAASLELHPDRQAMLDDDIPHSSTNEIQDLHHKKGRRHQRQPRAEPFRKEAELANRRKQERTAQHNAFEEVNREREAKQRKREKFRKAMLRAKTGGRFGNQRRLGRESKVLLEKVQRVVQG